MNRKWRFRLQRTFFGLTDEYIENVYEQFFFLKYSGGWSFSEAYNLPIGLRDWFTKRLIKQLKQIGIICSKPEGRPKCDWVIVDAASVVIHLFRSEIRELYNLEKLWNMSIDPVDIKLA